MDPQPIRLYLQYLADPQSLRDDKKITAAQKAVENATDPLDELKARADLKHAQTVDGSEFRRGFIEHAKAYADAENIPTDAFLEMGVPRDDLVEAGFDVAARTTRASSSTTNRSTRQRVSSDDVRQVALSFSTLFTINDVVEHTGASIGTVRKVVAELLDEGKLKDAGEDPEWTSRGRAPTRYDNS